MKSIRNATRDTFQSLHVRNFRLFFTGQVISQVGNWLTLVAQTLLVLQLTDSGVALGLLAAAQFGPILLLGPFAGLVADRSDKRRLLLIVQTIAMAQSFALAALAFSGHPPVAAIYAVAFVGGLTMAFDNPARRSFVVEMVDEDAINNAVSLNSAIMTSSRIIGPALAGLLVVTVGFGWAFALDGLSYIAVLVALWMIRTEELHPAPVTPKAKGQVREGLRYARSVPELWVPLVMMAIVGTLAYNFQVVFPLFTIRDLGGDASTFTWLFSVVSVGALIGALGDRAPQGHRHPRRRPQLAGLRARARPHGVRALDRGRVPARRARRPRAASPSSRRPPPSCRSEAAPEFRGRVLALQAMVFLGSTPIGGPILGWICDQFGARYGVAVGAAAAIGAGLWGMSYARTLHADRRKPRPVNAAADLDRRGVGQRRLGLATR